MVVPYIGTWIETRYCRMGKEYRPVVPYIGTWIETKDNVYNKTAVTVVPYIGTWIETHRGWDSLNALLCRTLYRYVD